MLSFYQQPTPKEHDMTLKAKPVVKNKFWIVEEDGEPVATIQSSPDGVVLVKKQYREKFPSLKMLSANYNIKIDRYSPTPAAKTKSIYGFPIDSKSFNDCLLYTSPSPRD